MNGRRRAGSDINLAELFYSGDRNTAGDYLTSHGWRCHIRSTAEAFAANGFELPETNSPTLTGDSGYLTAILRRSTMARTDDDSWDLASSVGPTATMVAAQRVLANREGLIDDPFAEPFVRAVGMDFFTKALDGEIDLEDLDPRFSMRRAAEGMAVRTRHFDRLFTDAAAAGVRQAVILAAGLDARAYRLPWPDGTVVYEVDQPEVIDFKSRTLAGLGAQPTADRRTVAIDLRDDWPKALLRQRLRHDPADRMDRRGPADLSPARGPGPAVRQDQRAQRARQPGRHRTHPRCQHVLRRAVAASSRIG